MDSESSTDAKPSQGRGVTWFIWLLVLVVFIGYPLSIGPVLSAYGSRAPNWVEQLYAPLAYAYRNIPVARAFYDWYIPLFHKRLVVPSDTAVRER